ncbi:MAG: hypothetical protein FD187_1597 [bacterium]|nr:MAG: hypothetical protein FD142_1964 [bacterium]KAF0148802.1 MAG: hypothetical protein FD187_1597 [bacterium]KAF0167336.1 MAG: hypothetical protein FD158_2356 [bacterium]TXT16337.1 MAG: hypothetical protein FD132_2881 [bacterium]
MQGIFISYRRQDSQSAAGRLADHLKEHLRGVPIFRDVETIEPGVDFVDAIGRALHSCGVLLAVIGPRWASVQDDAGRRRLDDPNDYTRLEIATALARSDVRVIPVLVEGAQMPAGETLPEDLKALSRRNATELTDKRWEYDVAQLVETLKKALAILPGPRPEPTPPVPPVPPMPAAQSWKKWAWGIGGLVILAAALDESGLLEPDPPMSVMPDTFQAAPPVDHGQAAPAAINLAGAWADAEGGNYQLVQQGDRIGFQGMSPHGPVMGRGLLRGNQLVLEYTLDGQPYQAALAAGADGMSLAGTYHDPATGESGQVALRRVR